MVSALPSCHVVRRYAHTLIKSGVKNTLTQYKRNACFHSWNQDRILVYEHVRYQRCTLPKLQFQSKTKPNLKSKKPELKHQNRFNA